MTTNNTAVPKGHLRAFILFVLTGAVAGSTEVICPQPCFCVGTIIQCEAKDLPSIVSALPPNTTEFVYTALEHEVYLGSVNFEHLTKLRALSIGTVYNQDIMYRYIAPISTANQNIFAPLKNLQSLTINVNWHFEHPLDDLFLPLVNLAILDLSDTRYLNITNLQRAMQGFRNQTELKFLILSNIQTYSKAMYSTFNLTSFLEPLQNCPLSVLSLPYNAFKALYPGILRYAPMLETIDVSHNLLSPLLTSAFFTETVLHKRLQHTDFSYQGFGYNEDRSDTENLPARSRSQRSLDLVERLAGILPNDIPYPWRKCYNALINDTCEVFNPVCDEVWYLLRANHEFFCEMLYRRFEDPPNENFYRGIPCTDIPTIDEVFKEGCGDCTVIPTSGSTNWLNLKNLNIYDEVFVMKKFRNNTKCFHPSNQLTYLDLSENFEHGYQSIDIFLGTNVTGLQHVKLFNLSNSGLTKFYSNIQTTFPELEVLDMSRNQISLNVTANLHFGMNSSITNLSLAYNRISRVPDQLFASMHRLRDLNLGHNQIQDVGFNISGLYSLETFNLEFNMLYELPETACEQLTQLAEDVAPRVITVDLSNNELSCSCSNVPFLNFLKHKKPENLVFNKYEKYMCRDSSNNRVLLHFRVERLFSLRFECLSPGAYVGIGFACASVLCFITVLLTLTIYKKRWWFKYQYFLAHRLWQNYHKIASFETPFKYDLFVSYNQQDQQWIDHVLQPKLEDEFGLSLCLHHRDFRLGEIITEQILESVETSRKTLFILSQSFLASTWCHFEMQMAQNRLFSSGEDVILLVLLEPLPDRMVSRSLKGLLETRTYVEWTEDDRFGQRLFWAKLHEAIQAPIHQPFELEQRREQEEPSPTAPGTQNSESTDDLMETEPLLARSGLTQSWHQVQPNV